MSLRHRDSGSRRTLARGAALLFLLAGPALAQSPLETVERMPEAAPAAAARPEQVIEFGLGLGRYDFSGSDETSGFDSQSVRYSRSRPWLDTWRLSVGRQQRLGDSSFDGGLSYTRYLGRTSLLAGISSGTGDVLANRYRLDLGLTHPLGGTLASVGYTRVESKDVNSSHGWSLGLTRWFSRFIVSAGYRLDLGQPGDTESSSTSLGVTWYQWRKTYLGVSADFGEVSYQLVGPDVPVSSAALVDYDAWNLHFTLSRYLGARSGVNLRYDHGQATDIWTTDGVSAAYFREW